MRTFILTEREREILHAYVTQNVKLDGFSVTILRVKHWDRKKIDEDVTLMMNALKKLKAEESRKRQYENSF
jgi:DNA primase large subunit